VKDKERAEGVYAQLVELDPKDEIALIALDEVRKALGKYAEIVESLMARSELEPPGEERSRIFAEIGRICATELEDPDQGSSRTLARSARLRPRASWPTRSSAWRRQGPPLERGAQRHHRGEQGRDAVLHGAQQAARYAGRWYEQKVGRSDTGLLAYQQILTTDRQRRGLRGSHQHLPQGAASAGARRGARRPGRRGR